MPTKSKCYGGWRRIATLLFALAVAATPAVARKPPPAVYALSMNTGVYLLPEALGVGSPKQIVQFNRKELVYSDIEGEDLESGDFALMGGWFFVVDTSGKIIRTKADGTGAIEVVEEPQEEFRSQFGRAEMSEGEFSVWKVMRLRVFDGALYALRGSGQIERYGSAADGKLTKTVVRSSSSKTGVETDALAVTSTKLFTLAATGGMHWRRATADVIVSPNDAKDTTGKTVPLKWSCADVKEKQDSSCRSKIKVRFITADENYVFIYACDGQSAEGDSIDASITRVPHAVGADPERVIWEYHGGGSASNLCKGTAMLQDGKVFYFAGWLKPWKLDTNFEGNKGFKLLAEVRGRALALGEHVKVDADERQRRIDALIKGDGEAD